MRMVWDYTALSVMATSLQRERGTWAESRWLYSKSECRMPIPETTGTPEARGLYSKRQVSVTVNVFNRLESLLPLLPGETPDTRAQSYPMRSPWLLGDTSPSRRHMCLSCTDKDKGRNIEAKPVHPATGDDTFSTG